MKSTLQLLAFALLAFPFAGMAQEQKAEEPELPVGLKSLSFVREEATKWYIAFDLAYEGRWKPIFFGQLPDKRNLFEKDRGKPMLGPGDVFFRAGGPFEGRFKFLGFATREIKNSKTGFLEMRRVAEYEDLKPNKKGIKYESIEGLPENRIDSHAYYDRTAVFTSKIPGKVLQLEFKVEELTHFALPPDATSKDFFLKEVSADKVVVEYKDPTGTLRSATIQKTPANKAEPANFYQRLDLPRDAQGIDILKQLALLKLTPKGGVDGQSLDEVLHSLNQAGAGGQDGGVINFAIRGHSDDAPKLTLPEKETNFAAALDRACIQAGFRWKIEFDGETKQPLLVLYKKGDKPSGQKSPKD
ncbi:Amuc_1099 family pilus-like system protein [Haloferula sp. BvORR071]|uniref:Amuc_1099 family pilus-like system protein n=1 Tax=Haloferula sp. BvORR071 TaxID=1396141 RepID=UPI00055878EF|nr:Amuc_1099 family pilus-like system protein [Haloferula sp. BvORR071]